MLEMICGFACAVAAIVWLKHCKHPAPKCLRETLITTRNKRQYKYRLMKCEKCNKEWQENLGELGGTS